MHQRPVKRPPVHAAAAQHAPATPGSQHSPRPLPFRPTRCGIEGVRRQAAARVEPITHHIGHPYPIRPPFHAPHDLRWPTYTSALVLCAGPYGAPSHPALLPL
eukprot:6450372-Prymnesium_polylepis.1